MQRQPGCQNSGSASQFRPTCLPSRVVNRLADDIKFARIAARHPRQQCRGHLGCGNRGIPGKCLGQGHGHQRQGAFLPDAGIAAAVGGLGQRRGSGADHQRGLHRRPQCQQDGDLLVRSEQGRHPSPDQDLRVPPGRSPHNRQRNRARTVPKQDDGWYRRGDGRGNPQHVPLKRWGEPADMAGTAIFLASRAGAYVSGAVIPVDGGIVAASRTL